MDTTVNNQSSMVICPNCGKEFPPSTKTCPYDGLPLKQQPLDPMIGTLLPRNYRITGKLGRGAMSVVYSGVYEPLNQPVAIKLLKSHLVSDQSTFRRFQQEAKTAGALEHENIVGILDFGETSQGVPYLIMELLEGESLSDRLKRSRGISLDAVISLFSQAADALQYTHDRAVIHRDVKPSNILILHENGVAKVKIVDFGIAKMQTTRGPSSALELTATGEVFGTPLYVSPEQAMGRPLDGRADIYSLGCVMYEAVAGVPAFSGETAFDVLRMQVSDDPMPLAVVRPDLKIPPTLALAVAKAMAKEPAQRYQSMSELFADLQQARIELNAELSEASGKASSTSNAALSSAAKFVEMVVSQRTKAAPDPVAQTVPRRALFLPIAAAAVAGIVAGVLILFSLEPKATIQKPKVSSGKEHRPVIASTAAKLQPAAAIGNRLLQLAQELAQQARKQEGAKAFDGAEQYYRQSLALFEKAYGRNDRRLAEPVENLAGFLNRRNRQVEARTLERRAKQLAAGK